MDARLWRDRRRSRRGCAGAWRLSLGSEDFAMSGFEASLFRELAQEADRLARRLIQHKLRLVLVESCTGGMISAMLARTPGISESLCGSWVVYREKSKQYSAQNKEHCKEIIAVNQ